MWFHVRVCANTQKDQNVSERRPSQMNEGLAVLMERLSADAHAVDSSRSLSEGGKCLSSPHAGPLITACCYT